MRSPRDFHRRRAGAPRRSLFRADDPVRARRVWLGLYVATALYLGIVMRVQGGYRLVTAIAAAVATSVFFYVVLEMWFRVPLLKGPLEAALGIH